MSKLIKIIGSYVKVVCNNIAFFVDEALMEPDILTKNVNDILLFELNNNTFTSIHQNKFLRFYRRYSITDKLNKEYFILLYVN